MSQTPSTILTDYLTDDTVIFAKSAPSWQDALRQAADPLLQNGSITPAYLDAMLTSISAPGGTYVDLGFGIALAHARPEAGVNSTALSLLHLDSPIQLADDPAHQITLFFVLAAVDSGSHLELMKALANLLGNAKARDALHHAQSVDELHAALAL